MFNEIVTSIKAQLYERAASPLLGSFIFSWVIWNYRFVMLIFSDVEIIEKYRIIDEVIFISSQQAFLMNVVLPLITSIAYLYIYPYPAKYVFEFSRNRQKEISNIKKRIEEETLLTAEEARAIRRELYVLEAELEKELNRKNIEIENLKRELSEFRKGQTSNSGPSEESSPPSIPTDELSEDEIEILKYIGRNKDEVGESVLLDLLKVSPVKGKYLLGELANKKYIKKDYSQMIEDYSYELTHQGRTFLVNRGYA